MKKILKYAFYFFGILLLLLLLHPLWVGLAAKALAPSIVEGVTKTRFFIDRIGLNLYSGCVAVEGVVVENPRKFFDESTAAGQETAKKEETKNALISIAQGLVRESSKEAGKVLSVVGDVLSPCGTNAVTLSSVMVDVAMLDTLTGNVHVRDVRIDGLSVYGDATFSNLREIADNASGEEDDGKDEPREKEDSEESGAKVVIDRVLLTNAKIKWGNISIPLPDVEVRDIGKSSEGATGEDAFNMILDAVCDASDAACTGSGKALKLAIEGGSRIGESVKFVKGLFR